MLVHESVAKAFLSAAIPAFAQAGVTLRGDAASQGHGVAEAATEEDWQTEYLDLILAVRVVSDLDVALDHIRRYGSRHTDAIVTGDSAVADRFTSAVDSSGVYLNCSTRFADGFRYGFGAEVGITPRPCRPAVPLVWRDWSPTGIACAVMATSPLIMPLEPPVQPSRSAAPDRQVDPVRIYGFGLTSGSWTMNGAMDGSDWI